MSRRVKFSSTEAAPYYVSQRVGFGSALARRKSLAPTALLGARPGGDMFLTTYVLNGIV